MNEKIFKQLKSLQGIKPSEDFARFLKLELISTPQKRSVSFVSIVSRNIFSQTLGIGLSIGLVAFLIIATASFLNGSFRNALLVKLLDIDKGLIAEASTINKNIDSNIKDSNSVYKLADTSSLGLREAAISGTGHTNQIIIEEEANSLNYKSPINNNIDKLLNDVNK